LWASKVEVMGEEKWRLMSLNCLGGGNEVRTGSEEL